MIAKHPLTRMQTSEIKRGKKKNPEGYRIASSRPVGCSAALPESLDTKQPKMETKYGIVAGLGVGLGRQQVVVVLSHPACSTCVPARRTCFMGEKHCGKVGWPSVDIKP